MGSFSFVESGSPFLTNMTFGEMKAQVGKVVGAENSPDDVGAGEAIQDAVRELQREHWRYQQVTGTFSVVDYTGLTSGQEGFEGTYSLPARFRDYYSLLLGDIKLDWVNQRDRDMLDKASIGLTKWYSVYGDRQSNKVTLLDWPTSAATATIKYWRAIELPTNDSKSMDLLEGPMVACVKNWAKAQVLASNDGRRADIEYHQGIGDRRFRQARSFDRDRFDTEPGWVPHHLFRRRYHALIPKALVRRRWPV